MQIGIGTHPVVLAVGGNQGTVESHIPALQGRHQFQLGRGEILFLHPIGILQQFQQGIPGLFVPVRMGADDGLELLAGNAFRQGLLHLVLGHVDQKVRNVEHRVLFIHADVHFDLASVLCIDHTHKGQGDAGPLVLLDAAIIMGAEVHHSILFVDRIALQVQPGGIDMGAHDLQALMHRFFADDGQDAGFSLLVPVDLVPGFQFFAVIQRPEAGLLSLGQDFFHRQPFAAGLVQEMFIGFAIGHDGLAFFFTHPSPYRLFAAIGFFHVVFSF